MEKRILQISAGRGPEECCRAVYKTLQILRKEAIAKDMVFCLLEENLSAQENSFFSVTISVEGQLAETFASSWTGTILWISKSPFRPIHKRKNWFIGISAFNESEQKEWHDEDVRYETTRSSGPGGQNVNKVETAVRGTHIPTGIQVLAMDSRSQLENKKRCLERLKAKVYFEQTERMKLQQQSLWQNHNELERGNPIRIFKSTLH
ncbi:MAG: peptide chain release factor H [Bacteroidota bacterium]